MALSRLLESFGSAPSRGRFPAIAADALRAAGYGAPIQIDAPGFRLLMGDDGKHIFNLDNFYCDYCRASRAERKIVVQKYVKGMGGHDVPAAFGDARSSLLPILRSRSLIEYMAFADEGPNSGLAAQPFSRDAVLMLAYDTEHAMITLTEAMLSDWGVSFDAAMAAASDNLRDATVAKFDEVAPGLFLGTWDDCYDTSRLLFPDVVFQLGLGGEPLMMIPNRGRLMVASANDGAAQLAMIGMARQFVADEGRPVSALMYRYDQGRAVEYTPSDPDVAAQLAACERERLAADYASQKEMLDQHHAHSGLDVFVASYQIATSNQTGHEASLSVWSEDVDTLLPETELVVLVSKSEQEGGRDGQPKFIAWSALAAAIGALERVPERYPARYRPRNFPGQAVRDALPASEL